MNTYLLEIESVKTCNNYVVDAELYFKKIKSKTAKDALLIARSKFETVCTRTVYKAECTITNTVVGVYLKVEA